MLLYTKMNFNNTSSSKRAIDINQQNAQLFPYFSIDDENPAYIQVQRVPGAISGSKVIFNTQNIQPNRLLKSRAYMVIELNTIRSEVNPADGVKVPIAWQPNDIIYKKPGMTLANSMLNEELQINSYKFTNKNPRYFNQHIVQQHCGRNINDTYLSTSGSSYPYYTGVFSAEGFVQVGHGGDRGIQEGLDAFSTQLARIPTANETFKFTEYLNIGCFNFMQDKRQHIYEKSLYKKMSPLIPYVAQVSYTVEFKDICANSFVFLYGRNTNAAGRQIILEDGDILSAELVLTWVKARPETVFNIPPVIKIQSFYIDHHIFNQVDSNGGAPVITWDSSFIVDQDIIIHQLPNYIYIWGTINKDSEQYKCRAVITDDDGNGGNQVLSLNENSQESRATPVAGITIRVNFFGGDDVIDSKYSNEELYRFTTTNSHNDYPWSASKMIGDSGSKFAIYPSQFSLVMADSDLNSFNVTRGQILRNFVINFKTEMTTNDGYGFDRTEAGLNVGGDKEWNFHVAFLYDRYYIQLNNCNETSANFQSVFL